MTDNSIDKYGRIIQIILYTVEQRYQYAESPDIPTQMKFSIEMMMEFFMIQCANKRGAHLMVSDYHRSETPMRIRSFGMVWTLECSRVVCVQEIADFFI